ncbi:MAG: hypothetical protein KF902_06275 [Phycisphaeraceae bacterium]|nr:hypothetical protein [Phycisphaeraceae bacterium]QYK48975.1 MAG: hypothetical protein KF838_03780 [Phycisphaeraceae bacterium]
MPETFGTAQRPWSNQGYTDNISSLLGASDYSYQAARPVTNTSTGLFVVGSTAAPLAVSNSLALAFYGTPRTDGDKPREVLARIWAFSEAAHQANPPEAWLGVLLADITIKFGGTQIPHTSNVFPGGLESNPYRFARDIIVTTDRSLTPPACRVAGQDAVSGMCMLLFDSIGSGSLGIQMTRRLGNGADDYGMLNCGVSARAL